MPDESNRHRNDIYGDLKVKPESKPARPAATVVLLRDAEQGLEVLMLRKNSKIAFGGMWVFPGGVIDPEDRKGQDTLEGSARMAAVREAKEEAGIEIDPVELVQLSHWTPPASTPVRFATWFFITRTDSVQAINIDDGEIKEFNWINPNDALTRHRHGEIDLAPPTWVTLYFIGKFKRATDCLVSARSGAVTTYETIIGINKEGTRVAMWDGDAGYENMNPDSPGDRHRLVMAADGFEFEHPSHMY